MLSAQDTTTILVAVVAAVGGLTLITGIAMLSLLFKQRKPSANALTESDDTSQIRYIISIDRSNLSEEAVIELISELEEFLETDDAYITVPTNVKVHEIYS